PSPPECARCSRALWPPPAPAASSAAPPPAAQRAWMSWTRHAPRVFAAKLRERLATAIAPPPADPKAVYIGWPIRRFSARRFVRKLRVRMASGLQHGPGAVAPIPGFLDPYIPAVELRWREIKSEMDQVDLFIAPSRFLLEQYVKSGMVRRDRILYSDYG